MVTRIGMTHPMMGDVLGGRYEIVEKRARGGMATVYRAYDRRLGRFVAVKVMRDTLDEDTDFARKFDREARAAARLSDPHVVAVFDQGHDHGRPYIVMEYVDGYTLRNLITREAPFDPVEALTLFEPVAAALAAAHDAGFVHRDVKPENVLISNKGEIKVADFGLARALSGDTMTATQGMVIGTVSYLPPELVTTGVADARSDVYSAGVVLFEMLTGRKPYSGESPIQVAYCHVNNDMPVPSDVLHEQGAAGVPGYLDALVSACTRRDPRLRPRDGRELLTRVRIARRALAGGVLEDERLTALMSPAIDPDATRISYGTVHTLPYVSPRGAVGEHPAGEQLDTVTTAAAPALRPSHQIPPAEQPAGTRSTRMRNLPASQPALDYEWAPIQVHQRATGVRADEAVSDSRGRTAPPTRVIPERVGLIDESVPARLRTSETSRAPHSTRTPVFPDFDQDRIYRRRRGIVALTVLVLTALMVGLTSWWLTTGRFTATPDLTNHNQDDAVQIARSAGLTVSFTTEHSETVAKGLVISSRPGPGERIPRDGTMSAVLSAGPERYPVPKLLGLPQADAATALAQANLTVGKISEAYDDQTPAGTVVQVGIDAGQQVKRGTPVDLVVSKGPAPVTVPDFTGKPAPDAEAALRSAGFVVSISQQSSASLPAGTVIQQSPGSGSAPKGSTITLVASSGPPLTQLPDVRGKKADEAVQALTQAGFQVKTVYLSDARLRMDLVLGSVPDSTGQVALGSTVTIYVM